MPTDREEGGDDRRNDVRRVLTVALALNIAMSLLKLSVGLISGSLAVIADAMHSATDALSSLTGLITNSLQTPDPTVIIPTGITNTRRSAPSASPDSSVHSPGDPVAIWRTGAGGCPPSV